MDIRKQLRQLQELQYSRGEPNSFFVNYTNNHGRVAELYQRCVLKFDQGQAEAAHQYVVAMTSCFETFCRDALVCILVDDDDLLEKALERRKDKRNLLEVYHLLKSGIHLAEWLASLYSFQDLAQVDTAFKDLVYPGSFLDHVSRCEEKCVTFDPSCRPILLGMPENWRPCLQGMFTKRHSYVHDANSALDAEPEEVQQMERVVIAFTHLATFEIKRKMPEVGVFKCKAPDGNEYFALFTHEGAAEFTGWQEHEPSAQERKGVPPEVPIFYFEPRRYTGKKDERLQINVAGDA